ncbi:proline hydroxylase [Mycobacterium sp. 852013-50091_SCH5140682]|uniref:2OG-Fe(II) oxygenase n=1 Tax=Mycobacterium sp. 852013-50091_SCH5140682 TaxID=1834109 RepID=UPI0007EB11AD|nr:2OG-Fe(II) oxygenase [Mycobacterium sp. 852013-50091_SCH5140682]OBC12459.1 proline hydroxylase [Mycobacterium sp. 852013-50091_SCH5140682]
MSAGQWRERVEAVDWDSVQSGLDDVGCALTGPLLEADEAAEIAALYPDDTRFRSTIDMGRYRFGEGQYRYFAEPYPRAVTALKHALYPKLLPIAREWWTRLGRDTPWPDDFEDWLHRCHTAGQTKSTAILLRYGVGDWNALHRDLYGDMVFPLQVVINLNNPGVDHTGGEFLLYEQRPRAQSRGTAVVIPHGHGLVFTTRDRPVRSAPHARRTNRPRGWSAAPVRHGVSVVRSGVRFTLGLVFHDAA